MRNLGKAVTVAAFILVVLRYLSALGSNSYWGLNHLKYLDSTFLFVWPALAFLLFGLCAARPAFTSGWVKSVDPAPAWLVGAGFLTAALLLPHAATPLLGDGLERIAATTAGLKALEGQPAPLDLLIHVALFKSLSWLDVDPFKLSWTIWRGCSYAAGGFAAMFVYKLAASRSGVASERWFIFIAVLVNPAVLFFFGYVENYVIMAAGVYGLILLADMAEKGKAPVWTLFAAAALLTGLHYFMILLVPALIYSLIKHGAWKPSRTALVVTVSAVFLFLLLAGRVVFLYYRGPAIFVNPTDWFSSYHLIGLANQALLACPALPLLVFVAFSRGEDVEKQQGVLDSFLGASSLILIVFFFILRPVIGPAVDWDLFAIPSLVLTPWLVLRVHEKCKLRTDYGRVAWSFILISILSAGPWLAVNMDEDASLARFEDLMEWETPHNDWAASYGYLRLGKYLSRDPAGLAEAAEALGLAIGVNPDSATVRQQAATVFVSLWMIGRAKEQMAMSHIIKAERAEDEGRQAEAAAQFTKALFYSKDSKRARAGLIRARGEMDKTLEKAIKSGNGVMPEKGLSP